MSADSGRPKRKAAAKAVAVGQDGDSVSQSSKADDVTKPTAPKKARGPKKNADPDKEIAAKPAAAADVVMAEAKSEKNPKAGMEKDDEEEEEEEKPKKGKKAAKKAAKTKDDGEEGNAGPPGPLVLKPAPAGTDGTLKIVSWNVNGLNACMGKAAKNHFAEYLAAEQPDILCIQETKINGGSEPKNIAPGYIEIWNCSTAQKGYAGTAIFTKVKPEEFTMGIGDKEGDAEGRAITVEFKNFILVNTYVPNSGMRLDRLPYRTEEWDKAMLAHLKKMEAKGKPVFWCGDLNVAHQEIDLTNPKTNKKSPGFTLQERDSFSAMLKHGPFLDSWRKLHPIAQEYTFYSYKRESRKKNIGWRLDYFVVTAAAVDNVKTIFSRQEVYGSDHVPLVCCVPRALAGL